MGISRIMINQSSLVLWLKLEFLKISIKAYTTSITSMMKKIRPTTPLTIEVTNSMTIELNGEDQDCAVTL